MLEPQGARHSLQCYAIRAFCRYLLITSLHVQKAHGIAMHYSQLEVVARTFVLARGSNINVAQRKRGGGDGRSVFEKNVLEQEEKNTMKGGSTQQSQELLRTPPPFKSIFFLLDLI